MDQLKQGTIIEYDIQNFKGRGKIVGVASILPILPGFLYIIEPEIKINNIAYDYSHFVCYSSWIKVIPLKKLRKEKLERLNKIV